MAARYVRRIEAEGDSTRAAPHSTAVNSQSIYNKLPVALQNLAVSVEGWRVNRKRYDSQFDALLCECGERSTWDHEAVVAYRDERIARFVASAVEHVPYYRRLFDSVEIDPAEIRGLVDLPRLPVLAKQQVRDDPAVFVSGDLDSHQATWQHTSGTTGSGLVFPSSVTAQREQWACWWRYRQWHGLKRDEWCIYFGGRSVVPATRRRPPYWRINRPGRQILFSAYHLGPSTAGLYIDAVRRSGAAWIHGYPSMIALLAGYIAERGTQLPMRWVTIGAESLLPQQVRIIEQAFGVKPIQHYGMAEAAANISECPQGRLHVDEDFAAVEFLPLDHGEGYRIVGTNLTNPLFPLIRYEIGDVATLETGADCDCGRPGRIVVQIDGRREDYIVTQTGARLGRLDHVFKDLTRIREAQLYQRQPGHMIVRVVKGPNYTDEDHRRLQQAINERVGADVSYEIVYVTELTRSSRGKLRFVVSEIDQASTPQRL